MCSGRCRSDGRLVTAQHIRQLQGHRLDCDVESIGCFHEALRIIRLHSDTSTKACAHGHLPAAFGDGVQLPARAIAARLLQQQRHHEDERKECLAPQHSGRPPSAGFGEVTEEIFCLTHV